MILRIIPLFALITLLFGIMFVYYDIKSRSVDNHLFLVMAIFAGIEFITFGMLQFSIMLVVSAIIIIMAIVISYYTGNIGLGDLPMIASILIFVLNIGNTISYLAIFIIAFMLSFLLMPFILYRKVLSKIEQGVAYLLVIITIIIMFADMIVGLVAFLITIGALSYIILREKDNMYKNAVRYLTKDDLVIGDLIENNLLDQVTRTKLGINKIDGLTNINNDIMAKIKGKMKLPIYSNSIPLTVPLLIGFICVILAFLAIL